MTELELNSARDLRQKIRDLEWRLDVLRADADNLVPILDGLPHGTDIKSRVENLATKILDGEQELITLCEQFGQAAFALDDKIIHSGLDALEQAVLNLRYVACLNFLDIQNRLQISDATTFYIHRTAKKKILNMIQDVSS